MSLAATPSTMLVVVGTDYHPFDRLVGWIDGWLETRTGAPVDCLVQHGTSAPPRLARGSAYLDHAGVEELMGRARVVVTHGGPTTIAEARRVGHRPVVVPRSSRFGEHVDDHQRRFASRLGQAGLIDVVESPQDLAVALERALRAGRSQAWSAAADEAPEAARRFGRVVEQVLRLGW